MMRGILSVRELCAGYGGADVVSQVSFALRGGEILCIAGESGCGKSTLLKALLGGGLFGVRATAGSVEMNGTAALIPQDPGASFNPIRTFACQFRETLASHGRPCREAEILATFDSLDLPQGGKILKSRPYEMSGGMNQRIAIALALLLRPRVVLCDEVTSALDVTSQAAVLDELLRLRDGSGAALIMVTHNLGVAAKCADTVGIMHSGYLVEYGPAAEVLRRPAHPCTRNLIAAIPEPGGSFLDAQPGGDPESYVGRPYSTRPVSANHWICRTGAGS